MALDRTPPAMQHNAANGMRTRNRADEAESGVWRLGNMLGRSSAMERLFLQMRYVAGQLRLGVIVGERGTGKALAAETLHALRAAGGGRFVTCTAEQFFTEKATPNSLEKSSGGTLYLSGIDRLNQEHQSRLLHLLGWLERQQVAAGFPVNAGVRGGKGSPAEESHQAPRTLILSSGRALRPLMLYGTFRSDLYQRLSGAVQFALPALRERRDDIPMLLECFLHRYAEQSGKPVRASVEELLPRLLTYGWPGNVGELEEQIREAAARAADGQLRARDLRLPETAVSVAPRVLSRANGTGRALAVGHSPNFSVGGARSSSFSNAQPTFREGSTPDSRGMRLHGLARRPAVQSGAPTGSFASVTSWPSAEGRGFSAPHGQGAHLSPGPSRALPRAQLAMDLLSGRSGQILRQGLRAVPARPATVSEENSKKAADDTFGFAMRACSTEERDAWERGTGEGDSSTHVVVAADDANDSPEGNDPNLDRAILRHIHRVLDSVRGNKLRAARLLGISRSTLYRLLEGEETRDTERSDNTADPGE